MQDEQNLVHRAQQGHQEAFAELYESHFGNIYRYVALRIGNRMEAEDITQLFTNIPNFSALVSLYIIEGQKSG